MLFIKKLKCYCVLVLKCLDVLVPGVYAFINFAHGNAPKPKHYKTITLN